MLQSVSGIGVHAARVAGDAPVHQLSLRFERERFRVERQDPPWKVVRAFPLPGCGALVHLHNVSGRRAGGRSPGAGCGSGSRRGRANHDHGRDPAVPASRGRRGFRASCEIFRRRWGAAGVSSGCRDSVCGVPPPTAHGDSAGARSDSVLVGNSRTRQAGRGRAFRLRAAAHPDRSLRRDRGRCCGKIFFWSPRERTCPRPRGCANTRTSPACARFRKGGRPRFGERWRIA